MRVNLSCFCKREQHLRRFLNSRSLVNREQEFARVVTQYVCEQRELSLILIKPAVLCISELLPDRVFHTFAAKLFLIPQRNLCLSIVKLCLWR